MSRTKLLAGLGVALLLFTSSVVTSAATPPLLNPAVTIAPVPNFLDSGNCIESSPHAGFHCANPCLTSAPRWPRPSDNHRACTRYVLSAINRARRQLGEPVLSLPTNWYRLSTAQQLFVILNLERTSLGFAPYLGLNAALTVEAQRAATQRRDPGPAAGFSLATNTDGSQAIGSAWSEGFSVLVADYGWMYNDGWAGSRTATMNIDCTSATAAACWAHRDELLGSDPGYNPAVGLDCATCEVGAGFAFVQKNGSFTDLIERPVGTPPDMTFTWAQELPYLTTSFTTGSSTTTTTAIPAPSSLVITRAGVSSNSVLVHWTSTSPVSTSQLDIFLGPACTTLIDRVTSTYTPVTTTSVINVTVPATLGTTVFIKGDLYSVRLSASVASRGAALSACLSLRPSQ